MKTLESDRGDQQDHESVVTVHGVKASTIWRNQNKLCSIFGRERLASIALPGQHEMQQMGRSWGEEKLKGGKLSLIVLGSQPGSWENSAETVQQWQQLPSCPKHMFWKCAPSQWSNVQRHKGPDSVDQYLHVFHRTCWGLWRTASLLLFGTGKLPPMRSSAQTQTTHTSCQQIGRMILAQLTGCLQDKTAGLEGPVLSYSFWKAWVWVNGCYYTWSICQLGSSVRIGWDLS